jgi:hypothetical protein
MMNYKKHKYLLFGLPLLFSSCTLFKPKFTEITSITQAQDVLCKADTNTLVVFDIDQTLIDPASKAGQQRYRNNKIFKKNLSELGQYLARKRKQDPNYDDIFEGKIWQMSFELVEPKTLDIIKDLQARGIKVIALTSLPAGRLGAIKRMDVQRYKSLQSVGIDFSSSFKEEQIELKSLKPWRGDYPTYYKGIICAALRAGNTKGEALKAFLDAARWMPKKVIFFDDDEPYIRSVVDVLSNYGIPCDGFLYRAAYVPAQDLLDGNLVSFQSDYLKKNDEIIDDAQAAVLMHKALTPSPLPS